MAACQRSSDLSEDTMLAETKFAAEPLATPALGEPYLLTPAR